MFGSPERTSVFSRLKRDRSESPRHRPMLKEQRDGRVFNRPGSKENSVSAHSKSRYQSSRSKKIETIPMKPYHEGTSSQRMQPLSESVCEETYPFTPWIRYFDFPKKIRMSNNVKTYEGSDNPEDHLKIFQAASKVEHWAMPTWCHMFNSTLTGSARARQKSPGMHENLKIHARNYQPELIKRLHDNIPKSVDEMMRVTTTFLMGEVAASNHMRKKTQPVWKQLETRRKQHFQKRRDFRIQQRSEQRHDKFILLTKSPREILTLDKGKFKALPPMTTPVEKRNGKKFCEFHEEVGHNTNECMHLRRKIDELIKAKKLSHGIKDLKQNNEKDKPKAAKNGEASGKKRITQSFSPNLEILFPPLGDEDRTKGPMIIEAEIEGHSIHRIDYSSHWFQWRTHMANRTNTAASEDRETRNQENPSNLISSSQNVKIPSSRRSTHSIEQQDNSTRVHDGLRTRSTAFRCHSGCRRKNQSGNPEQAIAIGSTLTEEGRKALCELLRRNLDIFTWKPKYMTGVPRHLKEHRLNVREGCLSSRQ
nr:reverse transcriptase domain-containing protein [Tanacetum cinerariifolium]